MKCRVCDSEKLELVINLGDQPWCNHFLTSEEVDSGYGFGHIHELRYFHDLFNSDRKIKGGRVLIEHGRRALMIVHSVYASVETGNWIVIDKEVKSSRLGLRNEE